MDAESHSAQLYSYYDVTREEDFPVGERLLIEAGEDSIILLATEHGYRAIADRCSHDDGPLADGEVGGEEIVCPRHGASFSLKNGSALSLPAVTPVAVYPVRVQDGVVQLGIPVE